MPSLVDQIGPFRFLRLEGPPLVRPETCERIVRPGVDGVALLRTGRRGRVVVYRSYVDARSLQAATILAAQYAGLAAGDGVVLLWAGAIGVRVAIEDVQPVAIRPLRGALGGLNPPSRALLICDWTLEMLPA